MRERWKRLYAYVRPRLVLLIAATLALCYGLGAIWLWWGAVAYEHPGPAIAAVVLGVVLLAVGAVLHALGRENARLEQVVKAGSLPRVVGLDLLMRRWLALAPQPTPADREIINEQIQITLSIASKAYRHSHKIEILEAFPGTKLRGGAFLIQAGSTRPRVLKFDSLVNISAEESRYERCVKPYLGQTSGKPERPEQNYGMIGGQEWGAIEYDLAGDDMLGGMGEPAAAALHRIQTFHQYYQEHPVGRVQDAVELVFLSMRRWWANRDPVTACGLVQPLSVEYKRLTEKCDLMLEKANQLGQELEIDALGRLTAATSEVRLGPSLSVYNPFYWITHVFTSGGLADWAHHRVDTIVHGDFHAGNILISEHSRPSRAAEGADQLVRAWMIDFPKTHVGPTIQDIARLEADIKCGLSPSVEEYSLDELYALEAKWLFAWPPPDQPTQEVIPPPPLPDPRLWKAQKVILQLRQEATHYMTGVNELRPYYLALLHATLPMLYYRDRSNRQKLYAFISAALLCKRLTAVQAALTP